MNEKTDKLSLHESDRRQTLRNQEKIQSNPNLYAWYRKLYEHQFQNWKDNLHRKTILEIGSGASPLKRFYPHVLTSDVLQLDYLDYVFDCHDIHTISEIADHSIDIITLTNVLHHIRNPVEFIINASVKLKPNGIFLATEPYFSAVSSPIYQYLHYEPVDFNIQKPLLENADAPLGSANIALPHLIFFTHTDWCEPLWEYYRKSKTEIRYYTGISYMLTGGVSCRLPIPHILFQWIFRIDLFVSQRAPEFAASFFTITLEKR